MLNNLFLKILTFLISIIDYSNKKKVLKFFKYRLNTQPLTIIDIGANIGSVSFKLARTFENSKIFAIEPTNYAYNKLLNNLKLNSELENRVFLRQLFITNSKKPDKVWSSWNFDNSNQKIDMHNCEPSGLENIYKELYKRFIIPFYIPILVLISLLLILYSKESVHYLKYRISIFFIGFIIIIFSETTLKFIHNTFTGNIKMILIPMISFVILYFLTLNILIKR